MIIDLVVIGQGIILASIVGSATLLVRALNRIGEDLVKLNGRLIRIETWQLQHDKQDDERYMELTEKVADLRRTQ